MGDAVEVHEGSVYDFVWKLVGGLGGVIVLGATALGFWGKDMRDELRDRISKVDTDSATAVQQAGEATAKAIAKMADEIRRVESEGETGRRRIWDRINADGEKSGIARLADARTYATKDDLKALAIDIKEAICNRRPVVDGEK